MYRTYDICVFDPQVRHISHEIRTPLNTTSIGVEVLEHELSALGNAVPNSLMEVVVGIRAACGSALVIVNELLTFEKLAAGMSTLISIKSCTDICINLTIML